MPETTVTYRVLGQLELGANGRTMAVRGRKGAVLAALLARTGTPVPIGRLEAILWGDTPPRTAEHALHVYVSELRSLGAAIERRDGCYLLAPRPESVDARVFERLVAEAAGRPRRRLDRLEEALSLWRGEPFAGSTADPAVAAERSRLADARLDALEARTDAMLELGAGPELVFELEALVRLAPRRERLWRQLMVALYRCERAPEALEHGREARARLAEEGLNPTPAFGDLERAILRHDGGLLLTTRSRPRTLPVARTSFVGRGRELFELRELLLRRDVRLVTLVGAGGSGKTRIALELASALDRDYPGGLGFAELAPLTSGHLVEATLARAVGATGDAAAAVGETRFLLVVDNFEHVLEAAPIVGRLLQTCPNLAVLATSRERLRLEGEQVVEVPPLARHDAMRLFEERSSANAGIAPAAVGEICARLDNLPLAIEVAAARADLVLAGAPLPRLDVEGVRDADPRHATLRATIRWSADRLTQGERRLLSRLSIFHGSWDGSDAEAVCGASTSELTALAEKSLLQRTGRRFALLETIREFAAEGLAEDELTRLRRRHANHYAALLEHATVLEGLEIDAPNLRAMLHFFLESDSARALRLGCALAPFWEVWGSWREGRAWLAEALEEAAANEPGRVEALVWEGRLAWYSGTIDDARALLEAAVDEARLGGDERDLVLALARCAWVLAEAGVESARSVSLGEEAVSRARELGDDGLLGLALNDLVGALSTAPDGDHERARELAEEALALWRRVGDLHEVLEALNNLGWVAMLLREDEDADGLFRECLALAEELGAIRHVLLVLGNRGLLALLGGELEEGERLLRDNLVRAHSTDDVRTLSETLQGLAAVAAAAGAAGTAGKLWGVAARHNPHPSKPVQALHDRWIAPIAGNPLFRRGVDAGRALGYAEAVELALEPPASEGQPRGAFVEGGRRGIGRMEGTW